MKWLELPLLWLVNVGASMLVALVTSMMMVLLTGGRVGPLKEELRIAGMFWLTAWMGSSLMSVVWYGFRRTTLRLSYMEGVGWGVLGFGLGLVALMVVSLGLRGQADQMLESLAEITPWALLICLPGILGVAPFTVKLWVLHKTRGVA